MSLVNLSACSKKKSRDQQLYTPQGKGPAAVHSTKQRTSSCTLHKARDQQLYTPQSKDTMGPKVGAANNAPTAPCAPGLPEDIDKA
eukprot:Em0006g89a